MKQKQGFGQSLMQMMTNTAFQLDKMLSEEIKIDELMYIFGQEIQNTEAFLQKKETLIWFCYRANIQFEGKAISDQGWGCLVRVGQMMLANALMRESKILNINKTKTIIINLFDDNQEYSTIAPFSIQQIIKRASINLNMKIGDWYTGPKIMSVIEDLNKNNKNFKQIHIVNFLEQCILESQIDLSFKKPHLLIIHAIIGDKSLGQLEIHYLQSHMLISQFAGAIIGKHNKAFYLIGFQKNNAIFMDPHYVQESNKVEMECNLKCQPLKQLNGTIALAFYISNYNEYIQFKQQVNKQKGSIFSIIEDTGQYLT
ncbi:unnamed protein product [Paramecium primaurelia]|uniref:Cysteine protease n=1 Tax=Paramecium primaurelia TaxID=5886 RepID=A0A8S1JTV2_PARPR|nr:unnamed protein product [Paramecium primaurelia]